MVFFFGRRLQSTAYLRESLIEGATQQELKVLVRELRDEAWQNPLDRNDPPPAGYGPTRKLWDTAFRPSEASAPSAASPEEMEKRQKQETEWREWEKREQLRFEKRREELEKLALKRAEKRIPQSIDISLLGGGFAFLLEFSTVIVIIFALVIFGILEKMDGKEIATILAAIAGYVLGKASNAVKEQEKPASEMTVKKT